MSMSIHERLTRELASVVSRQSSVVSQCDLEWFSLISGGEAGQLLGACLNDHQKQKMFSAVSGSKRSLADNLHFTHWFIFSFLLKFFPDVILRK